MPLLTGGVSEDANPSFGLGSDLTGASAGMGPLQANANIGLFQVPISASFLNPSATSTFNPTVTQNPYSTGIFNNTLDFSQIGGPNTSASLFGGDGGGGGAPNSANINYSPTNILSSNLPPPLQLPGMTPLDMGSLFGSPSARPNMMPMPAPNSPMANMMTTPQPIAAGGVSPQLAAMLALPQQQQQAQPGQQIIPGTATQAGGYDQPQQQAPMPTGGASAMGIPNMAGAMMSPQMGRMMPPSNQLLADNKIPPSPLRLIPPPPAVMPSIDQLGPAQTGEADQEEAAPEDTGTPADFDKLEKDALNRAEATTRQGSRAVTDYLDGKEKKRLAREADRAAEVEEANNRKLNAIRRKNELLELKSKQDTPEGRTLLDGQAKLDADRAVENRRAGNNFPVPQVPTPRSYDPYGLRREPLIHLGRSKPQTMADPITQRGLEEQEGQLWNSVYGERSKHYMRDTGDEIKMADADRKEAKKDLENIDKDYDKREKRESAADLAILRGALYKAKFNMAYARQEQKTGHEAVTENISKGNLNQNIKRTDLNKQKFNFDVSKFQQTQPGINSARAQKEQLDLTNQIKSLKDQGLPSEYTAPLKIKLAQQLGQLPANYSADQLQQAYERIKAGTVKPEALAARGINIKVLQDAYR